MGKAKAAWTVGSALWRAAKLAAFPLKHPFITAAAGTTAVVADQTYNNGAITTPLATSVATKVKDEAWKFIMGDTSSSDPKDPNAPSPVRDIMQNYYGLAAIPAVGAILFSDNSLLKLLGYAVLAGCVAKYVYNHWDGITEGFNTTAGNTAPATTQTLAKKTSLNVGENQQKNNIEKISAKTDKQRENASLMNASFTQKTEKPFGEEKPEAFEKLAKKTAGANKPKSKEVQTAPALDELHYDA